MYVGLICYIGINIMLQFKVLTKCFQILLSTIVIKTLVSDVLNISPLLRSSNDIKCFVPEMTFCRWYTCYRGKIRRNHILNFVNFGIQAEHYLWYTQTLNLYWSLWTSKTSVRITDSCIKCAQPRQYNVHIYQNIITKYWYVVVQMRSKSC